jgi:hypothetical protein
MDSSKHAAHSVGRELLGSLEGANGFESAANKWRCRNLKYLSSSPQDSTSTIQLQIYSLYSNLESLDE